MIDVPESFRINNKLLKWPMIYVPLVSLNVDKSYRSAYVTVAALTIDLLKSSETKISEATSSSATFLYKHPTNQL